MPRGENMKRLAKCASIIGLCTMMTGCVTVRENISVNGDGKMTTSADILYREDTLHQKDPAKIKKEVMTSVKSSFKKGHFKYITEKRDGKKYYGCNVSGFGKLPGTSTSVKNHKVTFKMTKVAANDKKSANDSALSASILESAGVKMTLNVTMPSKPVTNVGKVKGNTVSVNLLNEMNGSGKLKKDIVITSDDGKTAIPVWLGAVLIGAAIGAGAYYFTRKKD